MRALYIEEPGRVGVREIPVPAITDREVLIRVELAGICGSDLHIFRGVHEFRHPPVIPGHELVGTVAGTGPRVSRVKQGDRVTVMPQVSCGSCADCRRGQPMLCDARRVPGTPGWPGAFVEYFPAPEDAVFPLPGDMAPEVAVLAEPLAVAVRAIGKLSPQRRETLLIIGGGTIGLMCLLTAKRVGFRRVAVTDMLAYNLQKALALGADAALPADSPGLEAGIRGALGDSLDAVVVAAGGADTFQNALDWCGKSGQVVHLAMTTARDPLYIRPIVAKELSVLGSRTYGAEDFAEALALLAEAPAPFRELVTHILPGNHAQEAFDLVQERRADTIKVLLRL